MIIFQYNDFFIIIFKKINNLFNFYIISNTIKFTLLSYILYFIKQQLEFDLGINIRNILKLFDGIINPFLLIILFIRFIHAYYIWYSYIQNILILLDSGMNLFVILFTSEINDNIQHIRNIIDNMIIYISYTIYMLSTYNTNDIIHDKILTDQQVYEFYKYQEYNNIYSDEDHQILSHLYDNICLNLCCYGSYEFDKNSNKKLQISESNFTNKALFAKYKFKMYLEINQLSLKPEYKANIYNAIEKLINSHQILYNQFNSQQSYICAQIGNYLIMIYIINFSCITIINDNNITFGIFIFILSYVILLINNTTNKLYYPFGNAHGCSNNDIHLQALLCQFRNNIRILYDDIQK